MKKQIHELKMKLYEWRKRHIEDKYFKTFPERKGMATMEIVKSNVMPRTYYRKTVLDPWLDKDMIDEAIPHIKKNMARQIGEDLLEQGMIDIRAETFPDPIYAGKTLVAIIRVIPPMQETRFPERYREEENK